MKKLKTLISVMLCAMLVLSLVVPSMAADPDFKIEIQKSIKDEVYSVYKVLDIESYTTDKNGNIQQAVYKATNAWLDILKNATQYVKVDETNNNYVTWEAETNDDTVQNFAKYLIESKGSIAPIATETGTGGTISITQDNDEADLTAGWYLIDTTMGSLCFLSTTAPTASITEKNTLPTLIKEVKEGETWGVENDAAYGDTVEFKATINAFKGAKDFVFHDAMDADLDLVEDSIKVLVDDIELVKDTNYTLNIITDNVTCCEEDNESYDDFDCTFEVVFTKTYLDTITESTDIVITYSAILEDTAKIDENIPNKAYLEYGDNHKTDVVTTNTRTHDFILDKTDGTNTISGAEFELYKGNAKVDLVAIKEGAVIKGYRVATIDDTDTTNTIEVGKLSIKGLDSADYSLKEIKAPDGYNKLASDVDFTISSNGEVLMNIEGKDEVQENDTIEVINTAGSLLPSTGGTGTKVLFTVGGIMMVVAFVLFTSKRRMAAED